MADEHLRSPLLIKGALVQFSAPMLVPIPNIIVFQYNPEQLSRSLSPYADPTGTEQVTPVENSDQKTIHKQAYYAPYDPKESFNLTLFLDATDALEQPEKHPVAAVTGVADRVSALEMLMYPAYGDGALAISMSASVSGGGFDAATSAAADTVALPSQSPTTLFVWGPGRVVPVRLTSFTVDELQFNQLLYPHRAKVTLGLRVVTANELRKSGVPDPVNELAIFAYEFTFKQKQVLALANIANTLESMGLLPF